ncbi:K02A2.6-like [Cordylochernes scorpioides]|uniref:K02A2.6-like n=1 Tax=Cordylochernes scorpioides TaxID=51811 RepID=A0ABY6K489_9ARAC|nr:K02A2.6-like [Cordylochernes scorpioides]
METKRKQLPQHATVYMNLMLCLSAYVMLQPRLNDLWITFTKKEEERILTKSKPKYTTTEKECLAMVWEIFKSQPYHYGQQFRMIPDHHATRWTIKSQEYDFEVKHKSRKTHLRCPLRRHLPDTSPEDDCDKMFFRKISNEKDNFIQTILS